MLVSEMHPERGKAGEGVVCAVCGQSVYRRGPTSLAYYDDVECVTIHGCTSEEEGVRNLVAALTEIDDALEADED
jgi:hypothetical protein